MDPLTYDGLPLRRKPQPPKLSETDPLLHSFLSVSLNPLRQFGGRREADALGEEWIGKFREKVS